MELFRVLVLVCAMIASVGALSSDLSGKHRRSLRSIAGRLKRSSELSSLFFNELSDQSLKNLDDTLKSNELVRISFVKVEKKAAAKELGEKLADQTKSELVQILGHTVLLYRAAVPPSKVTLLLKQEMRKLVEGAK
ncbi:hypothetical protein B484DRAFT_453015 [Ochromonadaceae sp. CCMP2298]|nr:hypothetical protein B484DRAFT_453015 [Ochromonadaceae sp. CCMP2298]|mmetsp:Transcript_30094/g.64801  ORF Transcript_30094/g.64801 Transcript_30094/m.64801 type:complete len:136 (+) Transcript_30094:99-506(+)